ncbi:hypothetical protein NPIL_343941 [Nephila pilipes]|uniref:Uncharacterized protein n=1 Tax=Nephila pilipes TaxID=299642 RepID=A0A8X6TEK5_NEPPI|nr:hypothetical protein NPIL_343941 [Nephila pilipes]
MDESFPEKKMHSSTPANAFLPEFQSTEENKYPREHLKRILQNNAGKYVVSRENTAYSAPRSEFRRHALPDYAQCRLETDMTK